MTVSAIPLIKVVILLGLLAIDIAVPQVLFYQGQVSFLGISPASAGARHYLDDVIGVESEPANHGVSLLLTICSTDDDVIR